MEFAGPTLQLPRAAESGGKSTSDGTMSLQHMHAGTSRAGGESWLPAALVVVAVLFNAVLAIVNGNVRPLSQGMIIAVEVAIALAAHAIALANYRREMTPWYLFIIAIGLFAIVRMVTLGAFEVKYFRDLFLIPTFVVLGMVSSRRQMIRAMLVVTAVVVAGILLEAADVDLFSRVFEVKSYYVNTRGLVFEEFTTTGSDLFISATRPEARFFPFFDLHRLSSVFLEPVSLGNFALILMAFTLAFWRHLSAGARAFIAVSILLTLFACDGRLSAVASLVILLATAFVRVLPVNIALLYLPLIVLGAIGATIVLDLEGGPDDFPGRIAHTVDLLGQLGLADWLGASNRLLEPAEDSGLVYIVITHSILGLLLFWVLNVLALEERTLEQKTYKNALFLYLALTMMVSYSFTSIKTAAPLWFIYGTLLAVPVAVAGAPSRPRRRASMVLGSPSAGGSGARPIGAE